MGADGGGRGAGVVTADRAVEIGVHEGEAWGAGEVGVGVLGGVVPEGLGVGVEEFWVVEVVGSGGRSVLIRLVWEFGDVRALIDCGKRRGLLVVVET